MGQNTSWVRVGTALTRLCPPYGLPSRDTNRAGLTGLLLQPPVERSLRLLEQAHVIGETGLLRGVKHQPLRRRIKGCGNGDRDVLGIELELGALVRKTSVPCRAKMAENQRRREGEIFSCCVSASDPHGRNGAERSAA